MDAPHSFRDSWGEPRSGGRRHQGVDIYAAHGAPVAAVVDGVILRMNRSSLGGIGLYLRGNDGNQYYYAHLAGYAQISAGQAVSGGTHIAYVGNTGNARGGPPHLHFEIRLPEDPHARWEKARAVDPLAFVAERLATPRPDSSWSRPYLEWAECAALIRPGDDGDRRPSRAEWWRALLLSTRHPLARVAPSESLRTALIGIGLLPDGARDDPDALLRWKDLARDLPRARELGLRLPFSPVPAVERGRACRLRIGTAAPASAFDSLGAGRDEGPTRADMCLVLSDLAGDRPAKPKASRRRSKPGTPAAS